MGGGFALALELARPPRPRTCAAGSDGVVTPPRGALPSPPAPPVEVAEKPLVVVEVIGVRLELETDLDIGIDLDALLPGFRIDL